MIYMIIHVSLLPGKREKYIKEFKKLAPLVRQEEGCLEYEIFVDSLDTRFDNEQRADVVVLPEKWDSIESLLKHSKNMIMEEFRDRIKGLRQSSSYELLMSA